MSNIVNQKITVELLQKYGYTVAVAQHGKEALAIQTQQSFAFAVDSSVGKSSRLAGQGWAHAGKHFTLAEHSARFMGIQGRPWPWPAEGPWAPPVVLFGAVHLAPADTQAALADGRTRGGETIYVRYRRLFGQDEN